MSKCGPPRKPFLDTSWYRDSGIGINKFQFHPISGFPMTAQWYWWSPLGHMYTVPTAWVNEGKNQSHHVPTALKDWTAARNEFFFWNIIKALRIHSLPDGAIEMCDYPLLYKKKNCLDYSYLVSVLCPCLLLVGSKEK